VPGALYEPEGPEDVVGVNMGAPLPLYMYCGAMALERLDRPRLKVWGRCCRISIPWFVKYSCSFSMKGCGVDTADG
jgi:hypothetical protein